MVADDSPTAPPAKTTLAAHGSTGCCTATLPAAQAVIPPAAHADGHAKSASCCDHDHGAHGCQKHDHACHHSARGDDSASDDATSDAPGGIIGFHALGCRGISMFWVSCGAVAPLPPPVPAACRPALSGTVAVVSFTASSAIAETPDPPPKLPS
jgi:hypothetical protein